MLHDLGNGESSPTRSGQRDTPSLIDETHRDTPVSAFYRLVAVVDDDCEDSSVSDRFFDIDRRSSVLVAGALVFTRLDEPPPRKWARIFTAQLVALAQRGQVEFFYDEVDSHLMIRRGTGRPDLRTEEAGLLDLICPGDAPSRLVTRRPLHEVFALIDLVQRRAHDEGFLRFPLALYTRVLFTLHLVLLIGAGAALGIGLTHLPDDLPRGVFTAVCMAGVVAWLGLAALWIDGMFRLPFSRRPAGRRLLADLLALRDEMRAAALSRPEFHADAQRHRAGEPFAILFDIEQWPQEPWHGWHRWHLLDQCHRAITGS